MPRTLHRRWALALSAGLCSALSAAQLPPPPPPGFPHYVQDLQRAFNDRSLDAYARLFDAKVQVFVDGTLVASDRAAYLKRIRSEFARNLVIRSMSWAQGSQILVMDQVIGCIPLKQVHGVYAHPCYQARAVRYDLGNDHKIAAVHILTAENAWNMHPSDEQTDQ